MGSPSNIVLEWVLITSLSVAACISVTIFTLRVAKRRGIFRRVVRVLIEAMSWCVGFPVSSLAIYSIYPRAPDAAGWSFLFVFAILLMVVVYRATVLLPPGQRDSRSSRRMADAKRIETVIAKR